VTLRNKNKVGIITIILLPENDNPLIGIKQDVPSFTKSAQKLKKCRQNNTCIKTHNRHPVGYCSSNKVFKGFNKKLCCRKDAARCFVYVSS